MLALSQAWQIPCLAAPWNGNDRTVNIGLNSTYHSDRAGLLDTSKWVLLLGLGGILSLTEGLVGLLPVASATLAAGLRIALFTVAAGGLLAAFRPRRPSPSDTLAAAFLPDIVSLGQAKASSADVADTVPRASQIIETIAYFSKISAVLKAETERVIEDTEHNAVSLMEELRSVQTGMEALLSFISDAGSNDRVVQIIEHTEFSTGA